MRSHRGLIAQQGCSYFPAADEVVMEQAARYINVINKTFTTAGVVPLRLEPVT